MFILDIIKEIGYILLIPFDMLIPFTKKVATGVVKNVISKAVLKPSTTKAANLSNTGISSSTVTTTTSNPSSTSVVSNTTSNPSNTHALSKKHTLITIKTKLLTVVAKAKIGFKKPSLPVFIKSLRNKSSIKNQHAEAPVSIKPKQPSKVRLLVAEIVKSFKQTLSFKRAKKQMSPKDKGSAVQSTPSTQAAMSVAPVTSDAQAVPTSQASPDVKVTPTVPVAPVAQASPTSHTATAQSVLVLPATSKVVTTPSLTLNLFDGKKINWEHWEIILHSVSKLIKSSLFKFFLFATGVVFTFMFFVIPREIKNWLRELPSPELLVIEGSNKSTKILDRNGKLLYEIYVDRNYDPVKLNQIPEFLKQATIAVEDKAFYTHKGVRPESIVRAARETLVNKNTQGGSTITQQLIKNVLLSPERTLSRKVKEVILALLVESKYSKDQILEMYLNNISYGGTAWGIQAASQKFFNKNVWELDLAEASLLAGLPSSPSTYSPLTDKEAAKQRQRYVLDRMVEQNYITKDQADEAYNEELLFASTAEYIRAPHFVDFVKRELEAKYGKRLVNMGGLTVVTSLDVDLQDKVQAIVTSEVEKSGNLNISNGSAVVLDAKNSEILAYVGSVDYFKDKWGSFDVASAYRQPGSSIKPVTYALALAGGYTPATLIKDSPVTYQVKGSAPYRPVNYDGRYHGDVTLRSALANSYNIPAVRLASAMGPDNVVSLGREMGLQNWRVDGTYGLSVTLGGKEVRPVDLANVYGTFARKGVYKQVSPFLSIKDSKGYEIYSNVPRKEKRVLSEEVSYLIWNILSDNNARTPAFGTRHNLSIPGHTVAVKTGTTDSKRDNWTVGFTPSYVVAVWVGNNDNTPMNPYLASGLSGAAPIWNKIFGTVLEGKSDERFETPSGVFVKRDSSCGATEFFVKGSNIPATLCPKKEDDKEKSKEESKKKDKDRD